MLMGKQIHMYWVIKHLKAQLSRINIPDIAELIIHNEQSDCSEKFLQESGAIHRLQSLFSFEALQFSFSMS